ncbi:MAG: hypothetical protein RI947_364 [Candidatus Parcubacteria bacterium]|jgi:GT2 family glycosyltransferase
MKDLSVIIVSYNTKDITKDCLDSLFASFHSIEKHNPFTAEVIVVDNGSQDGSQDMLTAYKHSSRSFTYSSILQKNNTGFSKANNVGLSKANGKYILYLNSDVIVNSVNFAELVKYMDHDTLIGALTVRVNLTHGGIDPASHRGFPTAWRAFCYYARLEKIFGSIPVFNRIFGGYHLTYLNLDTVHQIDSCTGAFFMARASLLHEVKGFDETFFMYGEDLDLAYRIKERGYKVLYYPLYIVTHLKHKSGLSSSSISTAGKTKDYFYDSMKLFYRKHYAKESPAFINMLMYFFIDLKKKLS